MSNRVICLTFSDVLPWELNLFQPILKAASFSAEVHSVSFTESRKLKSLPLKNAVVWIIAKDWRRAVNLPVFRRCARVYASLLQSELPRGAIATLFFQRFKKNLPENTKLITHSPVAERFMREFERMTVDQVIRLPLPYDETSIEPWDTKRETTESLQIGILTRLTSQANLNYFLNIAHYVHERRRTARFRIIGNGQLHRHVTKMISELGLNGIVTLEDSTDAKQLAPLDLMIFVPLRCDHFGPVIQAAAGNIPVLCNEVPGINELVIDGKTSFCIPNHETKPMSELVIRFHDEHELRKAFAQSLRQELKDKYSIAKLLTIYEQTILGNTTSRSMASAA